MAASDLVEDTAFVSWSFFLRQRQGMLFNQYNPRRLADPSTEIQAIRSYCITVELMAQVKCYGSIMDVSDFLRIRLFEKLNENFWS